MFIVSQRGNSDLFAICVCKKMADFCQKDIISLSPSCKHYTSLLICCNFVINTVLAQYMMYMACPEQRGSNW